MQLKQKNVVNEIKQKIIANNNNNNLADNSNRLNRRVKNQPNINIHNVSSHNKPTKELNSVIVLQQQHKKNLLPQPQNPIITEQQNTEQIIQEKTKYSQKIKPLLPNNKDNQAQFDIGQYLINDNDQVNDKINNHQISQYYQHSTDQINLTTISQKIKLELNDQINLYDQTDVSNNSIMQGQKQKFNQNMKSLINMNNSFNQQSQQTNSKVNLLQNQFEIKGMMVCKNQFLYLVEQNGKSQIITRTQILHQRPYQLICFYEKRINIKPAQINMMEL